MKKIFVIGVLFYKKIVSPYVPPCCRYYPTCSDYMLEALLKYGTWKGLGKGIYRILRCNPFSTGGYDPVK